MHRAFQVLALALALGLLTFLACRAQSSAPPPTTNTSVYIGFWACIVNAAIKKKTICKIPFFTFFYNDSNVFQTWYKERGI